tara:strand:- start:17635 stop:18540 length:906 start_codon:yes stop_codon:yes gene_type:complete
MIRRIENLNELHNSLGYPSPKHPMVTILDLSNITIPIDLVNIKTIYNFYNISLKTKVSEAKMIYGRDFYDFQDGTMLFSAPEQVSSISSEVRLGEMEGWSLFFHSDLIQGYPLQNEIKQYQFFSYTAYEALHISDEEKKIISSIFKKIRNEYSLNIDVYSQDILVANISLLLNYCNRFYNRQFITRKSVHKNVLSEFENLLLDYFNSNQSSTMGLPTITYFSNKLNLSANYLSDLLKKETGKNATEHIHFHLIDKAKNMLLGTDKTINEIAFELGFEYPQYFSRLFKQKTGKSPTNYRLLT